MAAFTRLALCQLRARTAGRTDFHQAAARERHVHDDAVAAPGTTASGWCVREDLRGAARQIDALELSVREKSNRPAVRRPERKRGVVGADERARLGLLEAPEPQARHAI